MVLLMWAQVKCQEAAGKLISFQPLAFMASFKTNSLTIKTSYFDLSKTLDQWFSTFSLKRAKSRHTTLLESRTKKILTPVNRHVLFYSRMKYVTQYIRGFIERLVRAA